MHGSDSWGYGLIGPSDRDSTVYIECEEDKFKVNVIRNYKTFSHRIIRYENDGKYGLRTVPLIKSMGRFFFVSLGLNNVNPFPRENFCNRQCRECTSVELWSLPSSRQYWTFASRKSKRAKSPPINGVISVAWVKWVSTDTKPPNSN